MGAGQVVGEQPGVLRSPRGAEPRGVQQPHRGQDQGDHQSQARSHQAGNNNNTLRQNFSFSIKCPVCVLFSRFSNFGPDNF